MKKYDFISVARGIGIILVVLGHIILQGPLYSFSYAISIPLFFFLSGFVYKKEKYDKLPKLIKSKVQTLIIPYLIYAVFTYLYWLIIEIKFDSYSGSKVMPLFQILFAQGSTEYLPFNPPLWFVPCIFVTEILYFIMQKKVEKNKLWLLPIPIIGILMLLLKPIFDFSILPLSIDVSCIGFIFFSIGNILKNDYIDKLVQFCKNDKYEILSFLLLIVLIFTSYFNGRISMGHSEYNNFALFFIGACIGIYLVLYISIKYLFNSSFLKLIGDSSFTIMALHYPLKKVVCFAISKIFYIQISTIYVSAFYSIVVTLFIMLFLYLFIILKNKYFNWKYLR